MTPGSRPGTIAVTTALASIAVAGVAGCSGSSRGPHVPLPTAPPAADRFYAPPPHLAALRHGSVIRSRAAAISISDDASAHTVIFASTDIHGRPIAASETVFTPHSSWIGGAGKRPLLAMLPAYDSLGSQCDPSYTMQIGGASANSTLATARDLLSSGAELVVPDYEGPQSLFGIGDQEGRIVLDGILAAEQTDEGGISPATEVAAWGYSGGAIGAGWAAELQPQYAPAMHLTGVAEGGVPADIKAAIEHLNGGSYFSVAAVALVAIDRAYPHAGIAKALNSQGRSLFHGIASACGGSATLNALGARSLDSLTRAPNLVNQPSLQPVFAALRLGQHPPAAAIYNYQGTADEVVPYAADRALITYYCRHHVTVDFVSYSGANHFQASIDGAAGVATWLRDRLEGALAPDNCGSS